MALEACLKRYLYGDWNIVSSLTCLDEATTTFLIDFRLVLILQISTPVHNKNGFFQLSFSLWCFVPATFGSKGGTPWNYGGTATHSTLSRHWWQSSCLTHLGVTPIVFLVWWWTLITYALTTSIKVLLCFDLGQSTCNVGWIKTHIAKS